MSDEEDFDEFPSITVNSSIHESSSFSMPSAEELASQRAREDECERALLRLRAEHHAADPQGTEAMVSVLAHSDSSGSEGEAALAAAVGSLRMRGSPPAAAAPALPAVLRALRPHLPAAAAQLFDAHLAALHGASDAQAAALTVQIGSGVSALATGAGAWGAEEALAGAAWLCAAAAAPPARAPPPPPAARRTLHLLLDDVLTDIQVARLSAALADAALAAGAALELSDALRGGGRRADALAQAVLRGALAGLAGLAAAPAPEVPLEALGAALAASWRRLAPAQQYLALQLLARLLPPPGGPGGPAEGAGGARASAVLDVLAQATSHKEKTTDMLKVLVATTKLQVLFHLNQ